MHSGQSIAFIVSSMRSIGTK